eukprot:15463401-Alexandrium_andersonii.AAC.1
MCRFRSAPRNQASSAWRHPGRSRRRCAQTSQQSARSGACSRRTLGCNRCAWCGARKPSWSERLPETPRPKLGRGWGLLLGGTQPP